MCLLGERDRYFYRLYVFTKFIDNTNTNRDLYRQGYKLCDLLHKIVREIFLIQAAFIEVQVEVQES